MRFQSALVPSLTHERIAQRVGQMMGEPLFVLFPALLLSNVCEDAHHASMTRNLELIRGILLKAESAAPGELTLPYDFKSDDVSLPVAMEHFHLLIEAGLAEGLAVAGNGGEVIKAQLTRLTWRGHEFVSKAKNNTVWSRVTAQAKEKGLSTSVAIIEGLLTKVAEKYLLESE